MMGWPRLYNSNIKGLFVFNVWLISLGNKWAPRNLTFSVTHDSRHEQAPNSKMEDKQKGVLGFLHEETHKCLL